MADVKYQIFISSTFADLVEERQAVSRAILDMGHIPAGMELFPAADVEQLAYIEKVIDECDYYVLIVGARYGSLDPKGVSFTEREYDYAVETGKTVLAFVHANMDDVPLGKTDKDTEKYNKLLAFKEKVSSGRLVKFWKTGDELAAQAVLALTNAFATSPQIGWIRADKVPSHSTMTDVLKFREEIDRLNVEIEALRAKTAPRFVDAAGLDQRIVIKYSYKKRYSTDRGEQPTTFAELFRFLAPILHTPANLASVSLAVDRALTDRWGLHYDKITADRAQVQDALLHFVALGLVQMRSGPAVSGQQFTWYQLTDAGTAAWQELSYTRKQPMADATKADSA